MGDPVRVSLEAKDRPFREVIKDLKRASGQPIVVTELDPVTPITLSLKDVPFWEALQAMCRAEGGTEWELEPGGNQIRLAQSNWQKLPAISKGNLAVHFARVVFGASLNSPGTIFSLRCEVVATAGARPSLAWIEVDSWEDDKGKRSQRPVRDRCSGTILPLVDAKEEQIGLRCDWWKGPAPDKHATKLLSLRGKIHARYVLTTRTLLHLEKLDKVAKTSHAIDGMNLNMMIFDSGATRGYALIELSSRSDIQLRVQEFAYRVKYDRGLESIAETSIRHWSEEGGRMTFGYDLEWACPKEGRTVAFEVLAPDDVEDVVIPFDLRDIPLRS